MIVKWAQAISSSFIETILMVGASGFLSAMIGIPLGILLYLTSKQNIVFTPYFNHILSIIVNAIRSIPFIILLVAVIPLTRLIVGTSIGTSATIVPLTIAAIPFLARLIETALREIDIGLIEAAESMGATKMQIVRKILIPEALPGMIAGLTVTLISLVSYSAMAGAIGGGGLGDMAIRYGYQRSETEVMWAIVLILIILVQLLQSFGDWLIKRVSHST